MTSVFFTTILTCSMTGLVAISSGLLDKTDLSGSVLVTKAYNAGLPFNIGMYLVAVGIIFFSFTTISDGTIMEKDVCCISLERQEVSRSLRSFISWQLQQRRS